MDPRKGSEKRMLGVKVMAKCIQMDKWKGSDEGN